MDSGRTPPAPAGKQGDRVPDDNPSAQPAAGAPAPQPASSPVAGLGTRLAFAVALGLLAVMLVTSARTPPPPEVRIGQRVQLVELINVEQARNDQLADQVEALASQVAALEREIGADTAESRALQGEVDGLAARAGWVALRGPGVVLTLTDSAATPSAEDDLNDFVIHEEDLQAVINALWAGGAEAMAVNGHRVLATTAIRCVGNVLLLHGRTHSPPYVIAVVGDQQELQTSLSRDPAVGRFVRAVQQFKLGYEAESAGELVLPAYEGATGIQTARPATGLSP